MIFSGVTKAIFQPNSITTLRLSKCTIPVLHYSYRGFSTKEPEKPSETQLIVETTPDYNGEVIALPIQRRPLFPNLVKTHHVRDPEVISALTQKNTVFVGMFLRRSEINVPLEDEVEVNTPEAHDSIQSVTDIYRVGVMAKILGKINTEDRGLEIVVAPVRRIRLNDVISLSPVTRVTFEKLTEDEYDCDSVTVKALTREIICMLNDICKLNSFFKEHVFYQQLSQNFFENPARLADVIAMLCSGKAEELQAVLEALNVEDRLRKSLILLKKELVSAEVQQTIADDVKKIVEAKGRQHMLMEQYRYLKKQLGFEVDGKDSVIEKFKEDAKNLVFSENAKKTFEEELARFSTVEPSSAEANVIRSYLEWITCLPWGKQTEEQLELSKAREILDEDHYGLKDVKERILEFIAVGKLRGTVQGKIICFSGPPGVGKTSIGKSIARALNRKFYRFSVGGLTEVSELKGHRRTFVGAMPGKIIQALKRTGTDNPLILVDEIDKIGQHGVRGDPSAAMLEIFDPEQNNSFEDHYLDMPYDLSKVLFVCTANDTSLINAPLLDRMEVIPLSGYVLEEKMEIAKKYLVPEALKSSGISKLDISDSVLEKLIRWYTRENGVRNLKKQVEKIVRKCALKMVELGVESLRVNDENYKEFVGLPIKSSERMYDVTPSGVVMGLAWTGNGGEVLYIECACTNTKRLKDDKSSFRVTGNLGDVMKESTSIALTVATSFLECIDPNNTFFQQAALHVHVPEGAMPKDGPSAGITITTALMSLALNKPVKTGIAMTGEISLTGKVLQIGGLKEKVIAAKSAGAYQVIIPKSNAAQWDEIPDYIRKGMTVHFVETFQQVYEIALK